MLLKIGVVNVPLWGGEFFNPFGGSAMDSAVFMIAPAAGFVAWAVMVRRTTWRMKWERPNTLCVALQGVALFLVTPTQSRFLGRWLRDRTGISHLDDYLGHLCYLAAVCALIYAAACRVVDDQHLVRITLWSAIPGVLAAHVMIISLRLSCSAVEQADDDFFAVPCDTPLIVYWVAYAVTMSALMMFAVRLLWVLRRDPRSRLVADLFIGASLCGIGAGALRAYAVFTDNPGDMVFTCWLLPCLAALLTALAAGCSWRTKTEAAEPPARPRDDVSDDTPPAGLRLFFSPRR